MGVDTLISPARWLEPGGTFTEGHLLAEDGTIRLLRPDDVLPEGVPTLDGRGLLVVPGGIDAHTHFRQPGQTYKEGILNGSSAALKGGITTVLDMPNNRPPCTTEQRLARKRTLFAKRSLVNWGLHVMVVPGRAAPRTPFPSGKVYMAQSSAARAIRGAAEVRSLLSAWPRLTFHAEDESMFLPLTTPRLPHHVQRPREAIVRALRTISEALDQPGPHRARLVLCHVSTTDEVAWIRQQKSRGVDLWAETCPHYCLLTQDDCLARGSGLQVNPPLRTADDRAAVREAMADGTIDFVSSDHAPHTPAEKASSDPPSGIPSLEWMMPLLLHFVETGILTWKRFLDVTCTAATTCFGIRGRNGIIPGGEADLAVVGPRIARGAGRIVTRAGYAPFAHLDLRWSVHATVVNGHIMWRNGMLTGSARGREVVS